MDDSLSQTSSFYLFGGEINLNSTIKIYKYFLPFNASETSIFSNMDIYLPGKVLAV